MYIVTFQQFIITHDSVFVPKLASPKSGFLVWVLLQKIIIRFRIVYALFFFLRLSFCYIPPQRSSPWVHGRNDLQLRKPAVNKFATEDPCLPDPKYQIFSYAHTYLSSFHHSSSLVTHSPLPCPISFSLFNLLTTPRSSIPSPPLPLLLLLLLLSSSSRHRNSSSWWICQYESTSAGGGTDCSSGYDQILFWPRQAVIKWVREVLQGVE